MIGIRIAAFLILHKTVPILCLIPDSEGRSSKTSVREVRNIELADLNIRIQRSLLKKVRNSCYFHR